MIRLVHVTDLIVTVAPPIEIGATHAGTRRVIPITGGEAKGPGLCGRVLPAGGDFQVLRRDGVAELNARYAIQTDDGAMIYIENTGLRHGPANAMEKLQRGETVDPGIIYFRTTPRFETGAEPYLWLTRHVFVAEGARRPDCVELAVFQIL
ncbi:MAG TPA: DUF3237 domain-containing protein [Candidatus Solibacter sp.]|jgi:hypothetical protein